MNARYLARLYAVVFALIAGSAFATERFQISTLKFVYPIASGDFVVGLDSDSSFCTSGSVPNKYYHVVVGANGMTAEGAKKLFSASMAALVARLNVSVVFDDATSNCYVNRITVSN
jgi:hypothetical protein